MYLGLEMRASVRCEACSVLTPMPGIRNQVSCRNCATSIDFAARAADARDGGLTYPFGGYYDAVAEAVLLLGEGDDCHDARESSGSPVTLRRVAPTCNACDAALSPPARGASHLTCPQCADTVAVRWPDEETRSWDPRIYCIVGDGKGRGDPPVERETEGTYIKCGHCGAPTATAEGERKRARKCTFCGGVNYLSDAAWLALFPQPEWHRCTLLYELGARELMSLHEWLERAEGKYWLDAPKKEALAKARAELVASVRTAAFASVAEGRASTAELERLGTDPELTADEAARIDERLSDEMRVALVPRAAMTLVRRFAQSSSAEVRARVAARPDVEVTMLETLAGDRDERVRIAVASHTTTPPATLKLLRGDPNQTVVAAAKQNPNYQPGFLEKLFGG